MNINENFRYLHIGLPNDVLRRKLHGDFEGAVAAIDRHLASPTTPEALKRCLTVQRELILRLPLDYPYPKEEALALLAETFGVQPKDPFDRVKALQAAFDPSVLEFSDEYYDTLGLENPRHPEEQDINTGCDVAATQVIMMKKEDTREKSQDHRLENHPG